MLAGFTTNSNGTASNTNDDHRDFALLRLSTAGDEDGTFGASGKVTTNFSGTSADQVEAITLDGDGKIVAAGSSGTRIAIARYGATAGALDTSFDTDGKLTDSSSTVDGAKAVEINSGGGIVVAATRTAGGANYFSAFRYTSSGAADGTPNSIFSFEGATTRAMTLDGKGRAVVAGYRQVGSTSINRDFALTRFNVASGPTEDISFGVAGRVITAFAADHARANAIAMQRLAGREDRIVVAGYADDGPGMVSSKDFAVARYDSSGSLDTTFGSGGRVVTDIGSNSEDQGNAVVVHGEKIVVAGFTKVSGSNSNFALVRYTKTGEPDTGFGSGGRVVTDIGSSSEDQANAVAVHGEKIVVAGFTEASGKASFALLRYTTTGALDTAFGSGAKVTTSFSGNAVITAMAIDATGRIVVVGYANQDFAVARYNANGSLDTSFGRGGKVTTNLGGSDFARAVVIDEAGRIIVAGQATGSSHLGLARYTAAGVLDESFGEGGTKVVEGSYQASPIALQADGKIVVGGSSSGDAALARFLGDGSVDPSFGPDRGGRVTTDFGSTIDQAQAMLIHDGKIIVAGRTLDSFRNGHEFALARYRTRGYPSSDAALKSISVLGSTDGVNFGRPAWQNSAFRPGGSADYMVRLPESVTHARVTVAAYDSSASVMIAGASGMQRAAADIGLAIGENRIDVRVRSQDGTQRMDYVVVVWLSRSDVLNWAPTLSARVLDGERRSRAGCQNGVSGGECNDPEILSESRFSVNAPLFGGLRRYYVTNLSVEFSHSDAFDTWRRVTLTVEEDGGTVDLYGMTLELTANRQSIRLPIRIQNRVGHTNTWTWVEKGSALSWGAYSTVGVRIIPVTTGLQTVRVYYDEMRNGQPVDGFVRWDIARAKPHATLGQALIAVIPGEFVSINTREKAITTHARLLLRGDWPGSTIEYGKGTWDQPPNTYTAVGADGLTGAIQLSAEKSNTYVWVKVTNRGQVHTHLVIIDPPPRTFSVNPEARVTEGEEATVTVSLGSPATRGGVSFKVTTAFDDAGDTDEGTTADDFGEIVSTVTVPEGQRSATIAVPTLDDEVVEEEERFTVTLSHVGEPLWAAEPGRTGTTSVTIVDNDEPPAGPEPWNIKVVPGDGTLTVTWNVSSREAYEDSEIWHVLRWSQEFGAWANHRDPRAVGRNDGVSVDPGVTTYTITGLKNGVATGVFIRSMVGYRVNMSERDGASSNWVRTKGVHTTPVAPPNEPPTVAAAISDATIPRESGTSQVSLSGVFADPDRDDLTIAAASSSEDVATVSVSADHSTLTVSAQARGTATVTVTAADGRGGSVEDSFIVTVKAAPKVASAIADVSELAVDATQEISLSGVFTDADGDGLTVTANSSNDAVATVAVAADYSGLTLAGKDEGTATITVTAQDSDGNSASDAFDVTVPAAQLQQQRRAVELPGPVVGLTTTASAENGVTVSWSAPETGGAPQGYIVHLRPEDGRQGSGTTKRPGADRTTVTFDNLKSGLTYEVWTRAQNEAGKGERVSASITLPAALPGPVASLELAAEEDSVTVRWQAPETGGAPDGYIVHLKPEVGGKGRTKTPRARKTQVTFENLKPARTYEVWVRAQNEAGKGERVRATVTLPEEEAQPLPEDTPPPDDGGGQEQSDDQKQERPAEPALVSNFGQEQRLSDWSTTNFVLSQGFTTGNATTPLASIEASIRETLHAGHIATVRAELWSAAVEGGPGEKLVDLVAADVMEKGDVAFAAPLETALSANTAYHFVLYTTGRVDLRVEATFSEDEDEGGEDGWSISNGTYHIAAQTPEGGEWVEVKVSGVMLMRVNGRGPSDP